MKMEWNGKKIFKPFRTDLDIFHEYFSQAMTSNVRIVDKVAKYLVKHKGKQLRPMLVIVAARAVGEPTDATYKAAVVVEMLHTATLVHDDVVDDAELRRGFPTINSVWKNKVAILMGDYLLAKSLITATDIGNLELMNIIATVAKRMSKGELLQFQRARKLDIDREEYFQLIADKTASLISACCELGAITTGASAEEREIMRSYGENLGIAFQIKDDLLDYQSHPGILGKPVGNDLKDKKVTLPLLYAFENGSPDERKKILRLIKKGVKRKEARYITDFVLEHGGIARSEEKAQEYKERAVAELRKLPATPAREALENLAEFVVQRTK